MISFGCMNVLNVALSAVLGAETEPSSFAGSSLTVPSVWQASRLYYYKDHMF